MLAFYWRTPSCSLAQAYVASNRSGIMAKTKIGTFFVVLLETSKPKYVSIAVILRMPFILLTCYCQDLELHIFVGCLLGSIRVRCRHFTMFFLGFIGTPSVPEMYQDSAFVLNRANALVTIYVYNMLCKDGRWNVYNSHISTSYAKKAPKKITFPC